ncbi:Oidioi.mRNA.OKI2018_I69.chr1.g901.t1.cds [Oikopleura dioica]|uniref:Oidioi.mRNA.OKI2018_I69.chr1.g901.t1.cds n=1 Tax=Oikopleura dioica TaxID=34765 RepID=A0ABN7SPZ3_OIKDI|nr:Oidioi.mRNA.OKI2018_I69.chr1.g901.t1.cds [Oikopleura dioica]
MTLDRVENDEYVLQNTDFKDHSPALRIPLKNPYYEKFDFVRFYFDNDTRTAEFEEDGMKIKVVNEHPSIDNMEANTWYLMPTAFTLKLAKI